MSSEQSAAATTVGGYLGAGVFIVLMWALLLTIDAWVGSTLWRWFLEGPTGFRLTPSMALAATLLSALWTHQYVNRTEVESLAAMKASITNPIIILAIGYAAKWCIG